MTAGGPWRAELTDVARAASGGLLFGVPLLYTMEVWWVGSRVRPWQMLVLLGVLTVPVLLLNLKAGFRDTRDFRVSDAVGDTVEALAIGLLVTLGVLVLLREVTLDTPIVSALGKVVYESVPFCLGIGVARFLLEGDPDLGDDDGAQPGTQGSRDAADLGATALGAAFVGLSIAPTDEIPMVASAMSASWLLVVLGVSLVASYAIVFVAGFSRQSKRHAQAGIFQRPATETMMSYLVSLVVAFVLLWLFQRELDPPGDLLSRVVVLGFPAAVGGAAGRLAL